MRFSNKRSFSFIWYYCTWRTNGSLMLRRCKHDTEQENQRRSSRRKLWNYFAFGNIVFVCIAKYNFIMSVSFLTKQSLIVLHVFFPPSSRGCFSKSICWLIWEHSLKKKSKDLLEDGPNQPFDNPQHTLIQLNTSKWEDVSQSGFVFRKCPNGLLSNFDNSSKQEVVHLYSGNYMITEV